MNTNKLYVVYPDSIKMGLSEENNPVAIFVYKDHAYEWGQKMYEMFYQVVPISADINSIIGVPDTDGGL